MGLRIDAQHEDVFKFMHRDLSAHARMPMQFSPQEILETIRMVQMENLDIRTITMGISLRDCADPSLEAAAQEGLRQDLPLGGAARRRRRRDRARVRHPDHQQAHLGDADRARRGSVRPATTTCCSPSTSIARPREVGVNFLGGFSALVHKGTTPGDARADRVAPRGARAHRARLRVGQRRHDARRHQHGRRRAHGRDHRRRPRSARPIATASAAPSSSCSATPSRTTRSWPARSTASASPTA